MPSKYLKIKNILPREDDKIMSGYFGLVAIWVTQPLWPHNVPRSFKVSVILKNVCPQQPTPNTTDYKKKELKNRK